MDTLPVTSVEKPALLDHISTSQKISNRCGYGAPLIALVTNGEGRIQQSCCNHWDCPRCQHTLAAYHAHRMTEGARILSEKGPLWFITTTCIGKELDLETADDDYLLWTNRLLSTCRARSKRQGGKMVYVQVTERQKRGAAHSHIISTFCPDDACFSPIKKDAHRYLSDWFRKSCIRAGLGEQCRISSVETPEKAAGYIAKYLKKQLSDQQWPKHWKRIRYSHGWPDNALMPDWATSLIRRADWNAADEKGVIFTVEDETMYQLARHHMFHVQRATETQSQ